MTAVTRKCLLLVHELFFSMNVAWPFLMAYVFPRLAMRLLPWMLLLFYPRPRNWTGLPVMDYNYETWSGFDVVWWGTALLIFALLGLTANSSLTRVLLGKVAGFTAVAWFPLYWLCLQNVITYFYLPPMSWLSRTLHWAELVMAVVGVYFYMRPNWPLSPRRSLLLLAVHFGIWSFPCWLGGLWRFSEIIEMPYHYYLDLRMSGVVYVAVGFLSAVVWGLYIKNCDAN